MLLLGLRRRRPGDHGLPLVRTRGLDDRRVRRVPGYLPNPLRRGTYDLRNKEVRTSDRSGVYRERSLVFGGRELYLSTHHRIRRSPWDSPSRTEGVGEDRDLPLRPILLSDPVFPSDVLEW